MFSWQKNSWEVTSVVYSREKLRLPSIMGEHKKALFAGISTHRPHDIKVTPKLCMAGIMLPRVGFN